MAEIRQEKQPVAWQIPGSLVWIVVCCLVLGLTLNFGSLREQDEADVWISTLTSLFDLTPYEWGSNRFGPLAPILAMPIRDPIANHFVQNAITVAAMLGSAFLLGVFRARVETTAWACLTLWALFVIGGNGQFFWLSSYSHPYALSIFFGLLGWRCGLRGRWILAIPCFLIGLWVNISLGPWLAVAIAACDLRSRRSWVLSVLAAACFALNLGLASLHRYKVTFQFGVSRDPLGTALSLADHFLEALRWQGLVVWMLAVSLAVFQLRKSQVIKDFGRLTVGLSLACALYWAVLSWSAWIEANTANPRYLSPVLWSLALVTALPLAHCLRAPRLAWLGLAVYGSLRFGFAAPETWVARWIQPDVSAIRTLEEQKVSVLVGNYWTTWERTFFAYVRAYRAGQPRRLWACTQRSENTRDLWQPALLGGEPVAFDLKDEANAFGWLGVVYVPLVGKSFLPEYCDENFVIGRYMGETPFPAYSSFQELVPGATLKLGDPASWRFLGQGWDGPDPKSGGRLVAAHQADIRFRARAGHSATAQLELASVAGPQAYVAFLNGQPVTEGVLPGDGKRMLQLKLPASLLQERNVISLTFPQAQLSPEKHEFRSVAAIQLRFAEP